MPRKSVVKRSDYITDWNGDLLDKKVVDYLAPGCIVRVMVDDLRPGREWSWDVPYGKIYKIKDGTFWARRWIELKPCGCDYFKTMTDSSAELRKQRKNVALFWDDDDAEEPYLPSIDYKQSSKEWQLEDDIFAADLYDHTDHDMHCPGTIVRPNMKLTFRKNQITEIPLLWQPVQVQKSIARANLIEKKETTWPITGARL